MGEYYMKKEIYLPICGMMLGEIFIFNDNILVGLGLHVINILAIILIITFDNLSLDTKNILQSLMIFPLL